MTTPPLSRRVLLIYTGGTIGMGRNAQTGALEPLDFRHLAENMYEFGYLNVGIDTYQFSPPIDSSDMTPREWAMLVRIIVERYDEYDGFVILHGTDTMAYTASALSYMLENLTKPVILTGSQLPIGQLRTDGKENLLTSIELASSYDGDGHPMVPEVCIYFSGHLLRGNRSTKRNADGFNAFDSYNYPHLCDAGVHLRFHRPVILSPDWDKPLVPHYEMDSHVLVFSLFPGIQESIFRGILRGTGVRSMVIRTFGSGNAPHQPWLQHLFREASDSGVTVVNISQCVKGTVEMGLYDAGHHLQDAGVVSGRDSTVEAAVTKLMYLQARYDDPTEIRRQMNLNLRGEISS